MTPSTTTRKWRERTRGTVMKEKCSPGCYAGHPRQGKLVGSLGDLQCRARVWKGVRGPRSSCVIVIVAPLHTKVRLTAPLLALFGRIATAFD